MSLRARYLRSFDVKLAELRESLGRLGGADDVTAASIELRRRLQTLAGSGDVYGVSEVSEWARETLRFLDAMRSRPGPASAADEEDLGHRVDALAATVSRLAESEVSDRTSGPPELPVPLKDEIIPWSEGPDSRMEEVVPTAAPPPAAPEGPPSVAATPEPPAAPPVPEPPAVAAEPAAAEPALPVAAAEPAPPVAAAEPSNAGLDDSAKRDRVSEPPMRLSDPEITILGPTSIPPDEPSPPAPHPPPPLPPSTRSVGDALTAVAQEGRLPRRGPGAVQEIAVLVIDSDEFVHRDIRDALSSPQYRLTSTTDPEAGLEMARTEAPDLIFMGAMIGEMSGFALLERLRRDPLTQFVPVVFVTGTTELIERTRGLLAGAADFLPKPFEPSDVVERVQRIAVELGPEPEGVPDLGAASLPEIVRFIEREMRRGLLDSAELPSQDLRIHLGRGGEVLAATWSAVARLREVVARLSAGRVRFRAVSHGRLGVLALHAEDRVAVASADVGARGPSADLAGRVVLVVDDDPAVRWLFTSVLGDAGASVDTAADGRAALDRARARRPDVIVSDILMPEMDGWELCGSIRNDFSLRDIPIVLLSWKEDFFQRMKELQAGADEYLLKEAQRTQILDRLRALLRPRSLLEARLSAGREVHGRVDATGILTLVRAIATVRGDAKLTVRENWNLFELELRAGRPISVTRTATDGSFSRGPTAFSELLGVDGGRYSVGTPTQGVRANLEGELEDLIRIGAHHINELVRLVVGGAAMRIARLQLRPESLEAYLRAAPDRVRGVVQILAKGKTPRELVLEGATSLLELERILLDLVKRGGVEAIEAPAPETHIAMPPPTPDQRRWDTLGRSDQSDRDEEPPPPPARRAIPSPVPAEPAMPSRPSVPVMPEGRPSLAPMTIPAVRASSAQTRLAWTLVIMGAIVGIALWAYNLSNMARRPAPRPAPVEVQGTNEAPEDEPSPPEPDVLEPGPAPEPPPTPLVLEPTRMPIGEPIPEPEPEPEPEPTPTTAADAGAQGPGPREPTPPTKRNAPDASVGPGPRAPASTESGTLQVLAGSPEAEGVEVVVDGQPKGTVPMSIAVTGGLHEIRLRRPNGSSILRYVYVPAGESRRLIVPRID